MIIRPNYLEKLRPFIDVKLDKILAGIRRCGKSTILEMIKEELLLRDIDEKHIITRKYSNEDYDKSFTSKKMYEELKSFMVDDNKYYFLLDELQEINGWEKVDNTLLENYNTDIYVIGSNSKLMSNEISTYLTGR
ncbi:MAG: AAA family ATPase [Erysipelotrichaceae bacterium]|nr:AAA family ATPase [Erysipelotrichaceae bacterium]